MISSLLVWRLRSEVRPHLAELEKSPDLGVALSPGRTLSFSQWQKRLTETSIIEKAEVRFEATSSRLITAIMESQIISPSLMNVLFMRVKRRFTYAKRP